MHSKKYKAQQKWREWHWANDAKVGKQFYKTFSMPYWEIMKQKYGIKMYHPQ